MLRLPRLSFLRPVPAALAAIAIGALAYIAFMSHAALTTERVANAKDSQLAVALATGTLWTYGVVESADPAAHTVTIRFGHFYGSADPVSVRVMVNDSTVIGRQELAKENGIYTGMAAPGRASFADLVPGRQVAGIIGIDPGDSAFTARILLLGTPL